MGVLAPWNAQEPVGSATQARPPPRRVGAKRLPSEAGPHSPDEAQLRWRYLGSNSERSAEATESRLLADDFFEEFPAVPCNRSFVETDIESETVLHAETPIISFVSFFSPAARNAVGVIVTMDGA